MNESEAELFNLDEWFLEAFKVLYTPTDWFGKESGLKSVIVLRQPDILFHNNFGGFTGNLWTISI